VRGGRLRRHRLRRLAPYPLNSSTSLSLGSPRRRLRVYDASRYSVRGRFDFVGESAVSTWVPSARLAGGGVEVVVVMGGGVGRRLEP
jgi:hypothetical protein